VQVASNHLNQGFFAERSAQGNYSAKQYLRIEGTKPVIAYNAPQNKIHTTARKIAMEKPHLKIHEKTFRQDGE
jgi:hypothetical protein